MKKQTIELIEKKFKHDIDDINYQIYKNKQAIKKLADEQRLLKDTRKGLYEILRQIKA